MGQHHVAGTKSLGKAFRRLLGATDGGADDAGAAAIRQCDGKGFEEVGDIVSQQADINLPGHAPLLDSHAPGNATLGVRKKRIRVLLGHDSRYIKRWSGLGTRIGCALPIGVATILSGGTLPIGTRAEPWLGTLPYL